MIVGARQIAEETFVGSLIADTCGETLDYSCEYLPCLQESLSLEVSTPPVQPPSTHFIQTTTSGNTSFTPTSNNP